MRFFLVILLAGSAARAELVEPTPVLPEDEAGADADDAADIQENLDEGRSELEEVSKAESAAIPEESETLRALGLLGPANPLRFRAMDPWSSLGELPPERLPDAEGDVGRLLAALGGMDLATLKGEYDIPVEINEDVLEYIAFFQGSGHKWFEKWLARSHRWIPYMRPILAEAGAPLDLVYLAMIESGFSPFAYSWARASGFWQFISPTGRHYGLRDDFWVDERRDPAMSTRAAAKYLKALHAEFGDWYLAWAGYNAGEGKIRRAIKMYGTRDFWELTRAGSYLRKETKHYVPKLIAAAIVAKHPERFGFGNVVKEGPFEFEEVTIPDATDLEVVANAAGVPSETILNMNMNLRRGCTPPERSGKGYPIRLPPGTSERFTAEYAKIPQGQRLTFRHHRVMPGDTLGAIALNFGMPAEAIMRLNGIKNVRALRLGADLVIPLPTQIASKYPDIASSYDNAKSPNRGRVVRTGGTAQREAQKPAVPAGPGRYVIQSGDTLWGIAQRFNVDVDALKKWNDIGRRGHRSLQVGRAISVVPPSRKGRG